MLGWLVDFSICKSYIESKMAKIPFTTKGVKAKHGF